MNKDPMWPVDENSCPPLHDANDCWIAKKCFFPISYIPCRIVKLLSVSTNWLGIPALEHWFSFQRSNSVIQSVWRSWKSLTWHCSLVLCLSQFLLPESPIGLKNVAHFKSGMKWTKITSQHFYQYWVYSLNTFSKISSNFFAFTGCFFWPK